MRAPRGKEAYVAGSLALALLGAPAITTAGFPDAPPQRGGPGEPVPFVTIAAGKVSEAREPIHLVIRDEASWVRVWNQTAGPGRIPPPVDFGREMVIAVAAGLMPEPATLAIARITRLPDRLVVWYTRTNTRPPLDGQSELPSAPFHIVKLARSPLPVEFVMLKVPPVIRRLP